ncbi:MAG: HupE/UreJ family protein [Myxococcota bacterium]
MLWFAIAASAHEPGLSRVSLDGDQLVLRVSRVDARDPMRLLDGTRAAVDGGGCSIGPPDVEPDDNGFVATASLTCPPGGAVTIDANWFDTLPPGHRTVVEADGVPSGWLDAGHRTFDAARVPSAGEVALGYTGLGIQHILNGWDHLAFLVGLLLVARSARAVAGVVTGFTVAHSITLSLAALGWITAPSAIVEPAIAATIVWVGIENLFDPPAARRFMLTMVLGLVHGLGFAGLLSEIGLPSRHVPLALGTFNLGVELGQVTVVLAVMPALVVLRRTAWWPRIGVRTGSVAVAALGLFWLVTRLVGAFAVPIGA